MDEAAVRDYILFQLGPVDHLSHQGDSYFYYDPGGDGPKDRRFPFATLVTGDRHDQVSKLDRADVFRLNVGVGKGTFQSLFGSVPFDPDAPGGYDFAELDRLLPHPVYGNMYWLCVLNPSVATFEQVKPLLAEAYETASKRASHAPPE